MSAFITNNNYTRIHCRNYLVSCNTVLCKYLEDSSL